MFEKYLVANGFSCPFNQLSWMEPDEIKVSVGMRPLTVILFGWAGCKDRYLSKYAYFYEGAGYSTIRFTMPIRQVRGYSSYKAFARWFYRQIFLKGEIPNQIVWHVFSMNGCSLYSALWDVLHKEKRKDIVEATKGVIFDSCPAYVTPVQSANALSMAALPSPQYHSLLRETYRVLMLTYFSMHRCLLWFRSHFENRVWEKNSSYYHLLELDIPRHVLVIYGPLDEICSDHSIEKCIQHFAQRNPTDGVQVLRFENSKHVEHYRTNAKPYEETCIRFVRMLDSSWKEELVPVEHPSFSLVFPSLSS